MTAETPAELTEQILPLARGFARRFARFRPRAADDFESDAVLVLWDAARRYDPARGGFRPYLRARLRGAMLDTCRRLSRENRLGSRVSGPAGGGGDALDIVADGHGPTERELRKDFDAVLSQFPPRDRQLLDRRFFHGETLGEIATSDGVSAATVLLRLKRVAELAHPATAT